MKPVPVHVRESPREECGVLGISTPHGEGVAQLAFFGLFALQHRGQEAAGIAVSDGQRVRVHKEAGLVANVFTPEAMAPLSGYHALGHTRYSTTGSNTLPNVQPVFARTERGELMLGHNGNLTNARWLRDELSEQGVEFASASDTEVLAKLIAHAPGRSWAQRVDHAFHRATGAYTFTMLTAGHQHAEAAEERERRAGCHGRSVPARRRSGRGAHHHRRGGGLVSVQPGIGRS